MKRWIVIMALFVPLTYFIGQAQTNRKQIKTKAILSRSAGRNRDRYPRFPG